MHPALHKQETKGCNCACFSPHHNYEWSCARCDMKIIQHHGQDPAGQDTGGEERPRRPKYMGESSRSPLTRASQHLAAYRKREDKSFMWEHTVQEHGGLVGSSKDFVLTVTATDRDPVRRVLREAVRIRHAAAGGQESFTMADGTEIKTGTHLLNDKQNEWFGAWLLTPTMTEL
jgi:hypothetical protein